MRRYVIISIVLLLQVLMLRGQANTEICNQQSIVKSYLKKLPKTFCLPEGMILYEIYKLQDIDGDGLMEVIIDYLDDKLKDGDTILTSVFKMQKDSSYIKIKTFDNLEFPYYEDYNYSYFKKKLEETGDEFLYNEYPGTYRITTCIDYDLRFIDNKAIIKLNPSVGEHYYQEYEYDKDLNDWVLIKSSFHDEFADDEGTHLIEISNPSPTLSDFNLLDYL
jgi:hypothetical protein